MNEVLAEPHVVSPHLTLRLNPAIRLNVCRLGEAVEILKDGREVSAEPELPGFVLDLRQIWEPDI